MTVDEVYSYFLRLIRKNQSGSISSLEFADFWNAEQNAYMSDLIGHFQRGANAKTGLNTGLVLNQPNMTKLSPFVNPATLTVTAGQGPKPTGFQYELALRINGQEVTHINHGQIASVDSSVIDTPAISAHTYYCVEYLNYYLFLPSTVTSATLDYIKQPDSIVWNYTFDGSGRQVYNPTGSVDPQWNTPECMEITRRMIKSAGLSLADKSFEQFGESNIQTGN